MVDSATLASKGPVRQEPTKRRVRGQLGGKWLFDTEDAVYVWENIYYPYYYIPLAIIKAGPATVKQADGASAGAGFWQGTLEANGQSASIVVFEKGPLAGLVKITGDSLDFYAEDEKLLGPHPKDPYTRVECLSSSRKVRVELDGTVVAESTNSIFLHETNLQTRYYLSPSAVNDWTTLRSVPTASFCPYKGSASYYDLVLPNGREVKDAVWYYEFPTTESAAVQGRLAFDNDKFDIFVDGVKEKK